MHRSFVTIYVFMLIIWAVEKTESKQGGHQDQLMNAEDIGFYNGAACLSYGHSCWGAHGKRNADIPNNPNAWFLYRMALMRKMANQDLSMDQKQSHEEDMTNYFNVLKTYMQRNSNKKTNSDETMDTWNIQPSKYTTNGRYNEDLVLDPRVEYKLMKI